MAWEWVIFCYLEGWMEVSNIVKKWVDGDRGAEKVFVGRRRDNTGP